MSKLATFGIIFIFQCFRSAMADGTSAVDLALAGDEYSQMQLCHEWASGDLDKGPAVEKTQLLTWLKKGISKGYPMTLCDAGLVYVRGYGKLVPKDPQESVRLFKLSAEKNYLDAELYLGLLLRNGEPPVAPDLKQSEYWLKRAADSGNDSATVIYIGTFILASNGVPNFNLSHADFIKISTALKRVISHVGSEADSTARLQLKELYELGLGTDRDVKTAIEYILPLTKNQDSKQAHELDMWIAQQYLLGPNDGGVRVDADEAARWYKRAAADTPNTKGLAEAHAALGKLYLSGSGVPKDESLAIFHFQKAIDGEPPLEWVEHLTLGVTLAGLYLKQGGADGSANKAFDVLSKLILLPKPSAASEMPNYDAELSEAKRMLAGLYANGIGVAQDKAKAIELYLAAEVNFNDPEIDSKLAELGVVDKQLSLGLSLLGKDDAKSRYWLELAAKQDDITALLTLGSLAEQGKCGFASQSPEAFRYYERGAALGDTGAMNALASLYSSYTPGGGNDPHRSAEWMIRACLAGNLSMADMLATNYVLGTGVVKDPVEALAWYYVIIADGSAGNSLQAYQVESAKVEAQLLEAQLGRELTYRAQDRGREIYSKILANRAELASQKRSAGKTLPSLGSAKSSGTGTIISRAGIVLTAAHVIEGASHIRVITAIGERTASVVAVDSNNDLALLRIAGTYPAIPLGPSRSVRLGQNVSTIGFPNIQIQGFSPKVTRGEISSLNGVADDPRSWQISVPVQPGNSGGPLLDDYGNVVGVIESKLSVKAAEATNDLPQNVSYAIKSSYILPLLDQIGGDEMPERLSSKLSFEDLIAKAKNSIVLILAD